MYNQAVQRRHVIKSVATAGIMGLAGCIGGIGGGNDGKTSLRFAGWGDAAEQKSVKKGLSMFDESRENITVNYQNLPYDGYHQKLQTQISAKKAPDVFYIDQKYVGTFAVNDLLVNQGKKFDKKFIDGFDTSILDQYRTGNGGLYMIPFAMSPEAVGYNKKLFANVGYKKFPETWQEFRSALTAIKKETNVDYPLLQQGQGSSVARIWYSWVFANGGQVMNKQNTKCVVAQKPAIEALRFFRKLRKEKLIGTMQEISSTTQEAALTKKEVAAVTGGGTIIANTKEKYSDFYKHLGIARPPRPKDGKFGNVIAGAGYAISKNTNTPDSSLRLVKHMLKEGIRPYLKRGIALPVRTTQQKNMNIFSKDPRYQTMVAMTDDPRLGNQQWGPHTLEVVNSLTSQLQGVTQGKVKPRDALKTVENNVNSSINA